jgi:hypothetical protein
MLVTRPSGTPRRLTVPYGVRPPGQSDNIVTDSLSRRLDVSISASAAARPTHSVPSTLLPG